MAGMRHDASSSWAQPTRPGMGPQSAPVAANGTVRIDLPASAVPGLDGTGAGRAEPLVGRLADAGTLVRTQAGNASSVLSMGAAAALLIEGRGPIARRLVAGSILAAGADTVIQGARWAQGRDDSDLGTTVYAATGLLPASSLAWAVYARHVPHGLEAVRLAALGANLALIGYEAAYRGPRMLRGEEDVDGYLALGAAVSGIVMRSR